MKKYIHNPSLDIYADAIKNIEETSTGRHVGEIQAIPTISRPEGPRHARTGETDPGHRASQHIAILGQHSVHNVGVTIDKQP